MFSGIFIVKSILSSKFKYSRLSLSSFGRLLSTSKTSLKFIDEDVEITDYDRFDLEGDKEPVNVIHSKFQPDEEKLFSLSDKMPLVRNYKNIAVLLPWVKWGIKKRHHLSPDLLMEEACALINSIPNLKITYDEIVHLTKIVQNKIFTTGTLERVIEEVNIVDCDAVFISLNYLKRTEINTLEALFRKRVFDRYMVVLDIFRYHALSSESRMQIGLAEMPYLSRGIITNEQKIWAHAHKAELKAKLDKVSQHRRIIREKRKKMSRPSIAVIGYTNCGKTTLIRGMTSDKSIVGEDRLFATLDVTSHCTVLPCGLKSYFIDTVGFIQDIPINLIASFRSTLEDAIYADVIVYMRDLSHPNFLAQEKTVRDTLASMDIPEATAIVVVNSKCDLLDEEQRIEAICAYGLDDDSLDVSASTGEGMFYMLRIIESKVLQATGRKKLRLRLPIGSGKIEWLKEKIGIQEEEIDESDMNYCNIVVPMNNTDICNYRKEFKS